jgi:hypothetical protein
MESNFIRGYVGSVLAAHSILRSGLCTIKICMPERLASADPATVELPPARLFKERDLTIIDSSGMGFLLIPSGTDMVHGDVAMRSAVRLVPLVSDGAGESDGWGVA